MKLQGGATRVPFAFTNGLTYRIHNFGANTVNVYSASSSGSAIVSATSNSTGDFTSTQTTYWLEAVSSDAYVVVEPLITTMQSGIAMSPLSYVVQVASAENATLIGTFFSASGVALVPPGATDAVVSVYIGGGPETIGHLLFGNNSMWVDAVEFRGVLQGGPILVVEGSPASNVSTPETGYTPLATGLTIAPGPVIIGPNGTEQPARNTGTCGEPAASLWDTVITDETPQYYDIDVSGAGMTRLFVQWFLSSEENASLTVSAYPIFYLPESPAFVSANPNVQETFFSSVTTSINHVELETGKYRIFLSTSNSFEISVFVYLQRFQ